jgi:hypothetical protein
MNSKLRLIIPVLALTALLSGKLSAEVTSREYDYVSRITASDGFLWIAVAGGLDWKHGCIYQGWARSKFPVTDDRTKACCAREYLSRV